MKTTSTLVAALFVFCTIIHIPAKAQVNIQDSLALVDFYNSTGGPNWNNHSGWLTAPVKEWHGIILSRRRVTGINLITNNLKDHIPASLGNLGMLTFLNLYGNHLRGTIPSALGNLVNLNTLILSFNSLRGTIPPELGNLINLGTLELNNNGLRNSIPPELGNLKNLGYANFDYNQFSGSIPPELGNLANLTSLDLYHNQLSGSIPPELSNLASLTSLGLDYNQLSGSIPPELGNLKNLGGLGLSNNQLSGSIPLELFTLSNLSGLSLSNNQLSGNIPHELGNLSRLTNLDLSFNQLTGSIPAEFSSLTKLMYVYLNNNKLTGNISPELGNLKSLQDLGLSNNQLSGNIPSELGNLSALYTLDLALNQLSGTIPSELGNLTNLYNLYLNNNHLSGSIPAALANFNRLFSRIDISSNDFTFDGMELLAQSYPSYQFIYSPQANIPVHQKGNSLYVSAGGTLSNNTYKWYVVGKSDTTIIKRDSVFHPKQSGKYYAAVTNSICTQLTLNTDTIDYSNGSYLPPSDLNVSKISDTCAKLTWSVSGESVQFIEISYRQVGAIPWNTKRTMKVDSSFDICGLTSHTVYEWEVRNIYAGEKTQWVKGSNFTTTLTSGLSSFASSFSDPKVQGNISIQIMPNPNKGSFSLQMRLPDKAAFTTLSLYNNLGTRVWRQDAGILNGSTSRNITLENKLNAGVYELIVQHGDIRMMQKVVIVK